MQGLVSYAAQKSFTKLSMQSQINQHVRLNLTLIVHARFSLLCRITIYV